MIKLTKTEFQREKETLSELEMLFTMSTESLSKPTQPNFTPNRNTALKGSKIKRNFNSFHQKVKIRKEKEKTFP